MLGWTHLDSVDNLA